MRLAPTVAVTLAYLGGLNAFAAGAVGTCTGNVADNLFGIMLFLPFYALALALIARGMPIRAAQVSSVLILPLLIWQGWVAVNLSIRILAFGATACEALWRAPYGTDGNELSYVALWLGTGLGVPLLMALILWQGRAGAGRASHGD
jgi:hypothetical protein